MNAQLNAREQRKNKIKDYLNKHPNNSIILIKANMPSALINKPINYFLIKIFYNILLQHFKIKTAIFYESADGPYFLFTINNKDINVKKYLINIEQSHPLGRFIDLDYFIDGYKSVSRTELNYPLRKCFLCDRQAFVCIREQNHSTDEIINFIEQSFISVIKEQITELIFYSLIRELEIEDKFGLVTKSSTGNHNDMDYNLMLKAINVIAPNMQKFIEMGYYSKDLTTLLQEARPYGVKLEKKMFQATNGINTHKGAIFLLSNICLALGYSLKHQYSFKDIFNNIKIINKNIYDDFNIYQDTFTTSLYKNKKISGIRGVVKDGLTLIKENLNSITATASDKELRNLLFKYIIKSDDTVFIKRSNTYENYLIHKNYIKTLDPNNDNELKLINNYCKKHNLSFGGSADLLISSILLINLKSYFIKY